MKSIINNKHKVIMLTIIAFVISGLMSCSDTNNPVVNSAKNNNSGIVASTNVGDNYDGSEAFGGGPTGGGTGSPSGTVTGKGNSGKRALPLPCLNLDSVQMRAFINLRKETDLKNAQLFKDYEAKVKALRDAAMSASSGTTTTINRDSLNKVIADLSSQLRAVDNQISNMQKTTKATTDSISKSYQRQMSAAGADRVKRQALEAKMQADMKAAQDAANAKNKELMAKDKALRDQIAQAQKAMIGTNTGKGRNTLDPAAKAALDAQIKALADALKLALAANEKAFLDAFRNMLTPEQQAIYDAWLLGTPCDTTKKKTTK